MPQKALTGNTLTEDALAAFLDAFYARVRSDDRLGPVFAARIPDAAWPHHMVRVHDFWSSLLLRTGRYKGNPFGRHVGLPGIGPDHFARWLGLFETTARARFVPEIADALVERAGRIGESLQAGLLFRPEQPQSATETSNPS